MSTVTAHSLFSRAATYSAGASSLRCPKPAAVVSLPYARNSGKKTPRSVCYNADPKSPDLISNIPPFALVHPVMPAGTTTNSEWKIKEDNEKVELTFYSMTGAQPSDFQVAVEGDVLVVENKQLRAGIPLDKVRLHLPELYDKTAIKAGVNYRTLKVTVPKLPNLQPGLPEVRVTPHRHVVVVGDKI